MSADATASSSSYYIQHETAEGKRRRPAAWNWPAVGGRAWQCAQLVEAGTSFPKYVAVPRFFFERRCLGPDDHPAFWTAPGDVACQVVPAPLAAPRGMLMPFTPPCDQGQHSDQHQGNPKGDHCFHNVLPRHPPWPQHGLCESPRRERDLTPPNPADWSRESLVDVVQVWRRTR